MAIFKKAECAICGNDIGKLSGLKLNDGQHICSNCISKLNVSVESFNLNQAKSLTIEQLKQRMIDVQNENNINNQRLDQFVATSKFSSYIWFDDNHQWFVLPKGAFKSKIDNSYVFEYKDILNFEVLEDNSSIATGGLGKAIVGGALFGLAGAIAGGSSKKIKQTCSSLKIKITTRNQNRPVVYINFIDNECKKDSFTYRASYQCLQQVLSKFQLIFEQLQHEQSPNNANYSISDEIKKYKELLDMGAINQEEYDQKKKQLLNL